MSHFSSEELLERLTQEAGSEREAQQLRDAWDAFMERLRELEDGEVLNCDMLGSFYKTDGELGFRPAPVLRKEVNHRYEGQAPIVMAEGYQADARPEPPSKAPVYDIKDVAQNAEQPPDAAAEETSPAALEKSLQDDEPDADEKIPEEDNTPGQPHSEDVKEPAHEPEPAVASEKPATARPYFTAENTGGDTRSTVMPEEKREGASGLKALFSDPRLSQPGEMPTGFKITGFVLILALLSGMGYLMLNYSIYDGYNSTRASEEHQTSGETISSGQSAAPTSMPEADAPPIAASEAGEESQPVNTAPVPEADPQTEALPSPADGVDFASEIEEELRVADVAESVDLSDSIIPIGEYGLKGTMERVRGESFGIVVYSLTSRQQAIREEAGLNMQGYRTITYPVEASGGRQSWRVSVGQFGSVEDARAAAAELPEPYRSNFFISRFTP